MTKLAIRDLSALDHAKAGAQMFRLLVKSATLLLRREAQLVLVCAALLLWLGVGMAGGIGARGDQTHWRVAHAGQLLVRQQVLRGRDIDPGFAKTEILDDETMTIRLSAFC